MKIYESLYSITTILNNDTIKKIIAVLDQSEKEMSVTDIYTKIRRDQVTTSIELAKLRKYGLVNVRRDGKWRYYTMDRDRMAVINNTITTLVETFNEEINHIERAMIANGTMKTVVN